MTEILKKALLFTAMATLSPPLVHPQVPSCRLGPRQWHASFERIRFQFRHAGRLQASYKGLEAMYDDGYGMVKDLDYYYQALRELVEHDSGPPRWFCPVDASLSVEDAPLMLYLPGVDGMGMGLCMHHKALGRIFELRCLHIPFHDRTPFEGILKSVNYFLLKHFVSEYLFSLHSEKYLASYCVLKYNCIVLADFLFQNLLQW